MLRIPPETQAGRTFRLTGQGLPRFRAEGRGDLLARVRVMLPTSLDEHARDWQIAPDAAEGRPRDAPAEADARQDRDTRPHHATHAPTTHHATEPRDEISPT